MPTTPASQMALAIDPQFRNRAFSISISQALVVVAEPVGTANHTARLAYALAVLRGTGLSTQVMNALVNATNLVAGTTSYDFVKGAVVTDVSDAALLAQIASLWDTLASLS